jgi:hypothetical protein
VLLLLQYSFAKGPRACAGGCIFRGLARAEKRWPLFYRFCGGVGLCEMSRRSFPAFPATLSVCCSINAKVSAIRSLTKRDIWPEIHTEVSQA